MGYRMAAITLFKNREAQRTSSACSTSSFGQSKVKDLSVLPTNAG